MSSDECLPQFVTLVSEDGFEFLVLREAACAAGTIKRMLDPTRAFAEAISGRCVFGDFDGELLGIICEYLNFNLKHRGHKDIMDMPINVKYALQLLMAADYLDL